MSAVLTSIIALLAGVGVFIAGMNMMSDGLEKSAGKGMKRLLGKISGNRFAGIGVGAVVTAIIQSSSATSVMVIGLVNAGVLTLFQATSIIMGANIGTTITGIIVSLSALDIALYASALSCVGIMMTFMKNETAKKVGGTLCGLGLIFIGLDLMKNAVGAGEIKTFFSGIFETIDFPLLLILLGAIFTAVIQSSSAATGLVIIMVGSGALTVESALFIVLGSNIGTCVTAVIACIGATVNAKRTALIHLSFNVLGTILFSILLIPFSGYLITALQSLFDNPQMQIAWFHVLFNVTTTLVLIPFINLLVKLASTVIKDKTEKTAERKLRFVDDRLLKTPQVAMLQVKQEIDYMAALARRNTDLCFETIYTGSEEHAAELSENEEIIDFTNNTLTKFLISLSGMVDSADEKVIGSYFHVLNDLERIGDHAENFFEIGIGLKEQSLSFSDAAKNDIRGMNEKIKLMFTYAIDAFENRSTEKLPELARLEEEIDELKKKLSAEHFARLAEAKCKVELSAWFFSTLSGIERVADHLVNVGYSIIDPTGDTDALKQ
ncbi:MAG: Na/Pi cotransporter family protein [Clostridia bacterium]|nr:Na/Pi cotransporter family protein [Clostridia bacterium]